MTLLSPKFTLSRQDAAQILDISTRTLDRYIRSRKLNARKKGGTILLSEEEVQNFKIAKFQTLHGASPRVEGRAHRHIDSEAKVEMEALVNGETGELEEQLAPVMSNRAVAEHQGVREQVFEELYDLSRKEVREYQNKLEAVNYRLGQLEVQLKHSVPVLDYQAKADALKDQEVLVEGKIKRQEEAIFSLEDEVKTERLNKNIYIGLVFGLLALQPILWMLLQS